MEFEIIGWPEDDVSLELDYRVFPYAGKFVMTSTGKAVIRDTPTIIAALSFNEDRTDGERLWIRYWTVQRGYQGEGHGATLCQAFRQHATAAGYEDIRVAVNNPFAYEAAYRAGFGYTGEETGIAELILSTTSPRTTRLYHDGLARFQGREGIDEDYVSRKQQATPPPIVTIPSSWKPGSHESP